MFRKSLLLSVMIAACCMAVPFNVTENGKPVADIVGGGRPNATIRHAAEELQLWVKEITGAELPVVQTAGTLPNHIHLGTSQEVRQRYAKDFLTLGETDGYSVRRHGNELYIFGGVPKGVLNGVYRILQRNTDIIWARPDPEIGTLFTPNPTLSFKDNDYMDVPLMLLRGWKIDYPVPNKEVMWAIRNCANWCSVPKDTAMLANRNDWGIPQEVWYGHNVINRYIRKAEFWHTHPEFYAMVKGERKEPNNAYFTGTQLCFTNKEMTAEFIKRLEANISANPKDKWFSVCMEDNDVFCECPNCREPIKLSNGQMLTQKDPAFASTRFFMFLNKLARHLQKNHPGLGISTYAYLFAEIAPAIHVEDNVRVICTAPFKNVKYPVYAPQNEYSMKRLQSWLDIGKVRELVLYDYHGLSVDYPRPLDENTAYDYRFSYERGIRSAYSEILQDDASRINIYGNQNTHAGNWDGNEVYYWVINQLLWNPYQDIQQLRKIAIERIYGAAAEDVAEYLSLVGDAWNASPAESVYHTGAPILWYAIVQCGYVEKCRDALNRAKGRELSPKSRKHLERLATMFESKDVIKAYPEYLAYSRKLREHPSIYNNIIKNPSFEEHGDLSGVKQTDTTTLGANNWNFWRRNYGKCGISEKGAEDGKSCAWFADTDNACLLQDVNLKAGKYIVRAKVKVEDSVHSSATISIRFRSKDNKKWDDASSFKFFQPNMKMGEWSEIEGFFFTPPYDVRLSFQLGVWQSKGKVFFDNIELYRMD